MHHFFQDLEKTYNEEVPYHNAIHATDVLQGVYFSLQRGEGYVSFDVFYIKLKFFTKFNFAEFLPQYFKN